MSTSRPSKTRLLASPDREGERLDVFLAGVSNLSRRAARRLIGDGLVPEKRWGTPEDVGRAVTALACGEMPYATGNVLLIDGGLTLSRL